MNRTQRVTSGWLKHSNMVGDQLLLEGLLRRGFLAYRDDQGVWLGTGSHPADLNVLRLIDGIDVEPIFGHKDRMARVKILSSDQIAMDVALDIVALPENHFAGHSLWTGWGIPGYLGGNGWNSFRNMLWGTKLPICPMQKRGSSEINNALDIGVALLVKAFPLARVATSACCDGHGEKPAWISFYSHWNALWGKAVFDVFGDATPNSAWNWQVDGGRGDLHVAMQGGTGDDALLGMLNDIQHFARRLLNQTTIDKIGRARGNTLMTFGSSEPVADHFAREAVRQLALELSYSRPA